MVVVVVVKMKQERHLGPMAVEKVLGSSGPDVSAKRDGGTVAFRLARHKTGPHPRKIFALGGGRGEVNLSAFVFSSSRRREILARTLSH